MTDNATKRYGTVLQSLSSPRRGLMAAIPWVVLALSLSAALIFWYVYDASLKTRAQVVYMEKTSEISVHIINRMSRIEQILLGGAGLFNANSSVSRSEWRRYVAALRLSETRYGIQGVGFSKWLTPSEKESNIRAIRAEGFHDYTIRPDGERPSYTSIIYLEPFDWRNQRAFGFDMFSEPARRSAMEMARDSGVAAITGKVTLLQETAKDSQNGMLMYVPVYRQGMPINTVEFRRQALHGFCYSPVRIRDFMYNILGKMPRDIAFELYAADSNVPDALMFSSSAAEQLVLPNNFKPAFEHTKLFEAYGRKWLLSFKTLPPFSAELHRIASYSVLGGGIFISLLLSLIVFILNAKRIKAHELAQSVAESENRYHALFDLGADGVVLIDPETTGFIDFNNQVCLQLGYTREEFSNLKITDIELAKSQEAVTAHIHNIIRDGHDEFETLHRTKQGEIRNVLVKAQYSVLGDKSVYHGVWCDITRQKKEGQLAAARVHLVEYALTHSLDELLTETLDRIEDLTGSLIGFFHFMQEDQRTLTLHAWSTRTSRDFCKAEGAGSHYDIGKAGVWVDCVHQRQPVIHNDYASLPHRKGMPPGHAAVNRELGVPIFRSEKIVAILGIGNKAVEYTDEDVQLASRFADLVWDICERKQVAETLRESNERFTVAFNNAPIILTINNMEDGTFMDFNQQFLDASGYIRDEVIGKTPIELGWITESDRALLIELMEQNGKIHDHEITVHTKSGQRRLCKYWGGTITVSGAKCLFSIILDITEHRKIEQQYQQAQKMESIGRLAGGVAHDFNNMLTVINGFSQLGLMESGPSSPLAKYFEEICKASERSADLTRQLLAFARKQTIAPKVLDLNEAVTGMLKMLQRLIGEEIGLSWLPGDKLWPVRMDPSQIDQILANLCVNARDSINTVGKISIMTGNCTVDETYCSTHTEAIAGEYVRIVVSDNGHGMDKTTLSHIFEPFFTTKVVGVGTGLGLATVYGIVKQNNGFINIYSEPGFGTTFTIFIPRYKDSASQVQTIKKSEELPRGHETILLVEDEPAILDMTAMILRKQGYTIFSADSPEKAILLAHEQGGEVNLLITDVVMPEMSGRDLANVILPLYPNIKLLFMSGYTADIIAHHGVLNEGVYFIQKPFLLPDLAAKVREVLDSN
jgi:two-component system, cell cycle sensor histidine kinase and response regulator CckA